MHIFGMSMFPADERFRQRMKQLNELHAQAERLLEDIRALTKNAIAQKAAGVQDVTGATTKPVLTSGTRYFVGPGTYTPSGKVTRQ